MFEKIKGIADCLFVVALTKKSISSEISTKLNC